MTVNGIHIQAETILATRHHFAEIYRKCILEAKDGKTFVNDLSKYVEQCERRIIDLWEGKSDNTLTFAQRALWIQTGECIAILA